jgi:transposase
LRAKLWVPVLTAVRTNPWLRADYERLVARGKLLHAVYSVATHRRPFVPYLVAEEGRP